MTRLLPTLAALLCAGTLAWGAPQVIVAGPGGNTDQWDVIATVCTTEGQ